MLIVTSSGLPEGPCTVRMSDGSILEGRSKRGKFDGKVRKFGQDGKLQFVGLFRNGVPHGPVWLLPWWEL